MAARKPSERRNYRHQDLNLDLTPMMNLIAILIPTLLVSMAFIEMSTLEVLAPGQQADDGEPSVALRIEVSVDGYAVRYSEPGAEPTLQSIPLVERPVDCMHYTDTRPPPRSVNRHRRPCSQGDTTLPFTVYDTLALQRALTSLKTRFPTERAYTLTADEGIEYEALVQVMDGVRSREVAGAPAPLFDKVLLGVPIAPKG